MSDYQYKCLKCQERHDRRVNDCDFEDTYFAPCPVCGFVARRVAEAQCDEQTAWRESDSVGVTIH